MTNIGIIDDERFNHLRSERNRLMGELDAINTVFKEKYPEFFEVPDEYKGMFRNQETQERARERCFCTEQVFPSDEALSEIGAENQSPLNDFDKKYLQEMIDSHEIIEK